jgi:hypothetical protein
VRLCPCLHMVNWRKAAKRLELAVFREGMHFLPSDYEMVEDTHLYQRQGLCQHARQQQVRLTGFGHARRVVVRQHDAGGVVQQGLLDHFTRVDTGMGVRTLTSK